MRPLIWGLLASTLGSVATLALVTGPVPLRGHVLLLAAASLAWTAAWFLARSVPAVGSTRRVLLVGAVGLKCLAFGSPLLWSDDVFRYVWEGGLVARGISPYATAPADVATTRIPASWQSVRSRINHAEVPAAYPPATQALHAAIVGAAGGPGERAGQCAVLGLSLAALVFDLLVLFLLAFVVAPSRAGPLVAWGWCPWLAFECAGSAHFDVLGIALLVGALATRREGLRHGLLALGGLVKFLPLLVVPWTLRVARRRGRATAWVVGVTALGWASVLLLEGGFPSGGGGLSAYALRWESWNLVYRWIEQPLGMLLERDESWSDPRRVGRALVAVIFVAFAARTWLRVRDPWSAARALLAAFLFLSPTLHPWYLAWALAFFAVRPSFAWLWVFALAPLAYLPLERWQTEQLWSEPGWLMPLVSVPFLLVLALEARIGRVPATPQ